MPLELDLLDASGALVDRIYRHPDGALEGLSPGPAAAP
jgi:hypothetical protein